MSLTYLLPLIFISLYDSSTVVASFQNTDNQEHVVSSPNPIQVPKSFANVLSKKGIPALHRNRTNLDAKFPSLRHNIRCENSELIMTVPQESISADGKSASLWVYQDTCNLTVNGKEIKNPFFISTLTHIRFEESDDKVPVRLYGTNFLPCNLTFAFKLEESNKRNEVKEIKFTPTITNETYAYGILDANYEELSGSELTLDLVVTSGNNEVSTYSSSYKYETVLENQVNPDDPIEIVELDPDELNDPSQQSDGSSSSGKDSQSVVVKNKSFDTWTLILIIGLSVFALVFIIAIIIVCALIIKHKRKKDEISTNPDGFDTSSMMSDKDTVSEMATLRPISTSETPDPHQLQRPTTEMESQISSADAIADMLNDNSSMTSDTYSVEDPQKFLTVAPLQTEVEGTEEQESYDPTSVSEPPADDVPYSTQEDGEYETEQLPTTEEPTEEPQEVAEEEHNEEEGNENEAEPEPSEPVQNAEEATELPEADPAIPVEEVLAQMPAEEEQPERRKKKRRHRRRHHAHDEDEEAAQDEQEGQNAAADGAVAAEDVEGLVEEDAPKRRHKKRRVRIHRRRRREADAEDEAQPEEAGEE